MFLKYTGALLKSMDGDKSKLIMLKKDLKKNNNVIAREWLMENGFQGLEGQLIPTMTDEWLVNISSRYLELYKAMVGKDLEKRSYLDIYEKIEQSILLSSKTQKSRYISIHAHHLFLIQIPYEC